MFQSCPNCGADFAEDDFVCPDCGLSLPALEESSVAETTRPEIAGFASEPELRKISEELAASRNRTTDEVDPVSETWQPRDRRDESSRDRSSRDKPNGATKRETAESPHSSSHARSSSTNGVSGHSTTSEDAVDSDDAVFRDTVPPPSDRSTDLDLPPPKAAPAIPQGAPRIKVGYGSENDLVIPLPQVSGHHAVIALVDNAYVIEDRNSTNGTFVNGHPISRSYLKPGDDIGLGSYTFAFDREIAARLEKGQGPKVTEAMAVPEILRRSIVIGREVDCDIVLDAAQISRRHAELEFTGDGWRVKDLGSSNGTFVNDRSQAVETALVGEDDVLFFGSYRFPVNRIRDFLDTGEHDFEGGGSVPLPMDKDVITIGRGAGNDVVLDAPQISRHHARLVRSGKTVFLEDLGSANGTFIDGEKISRAPLSPGQTVSFGSYAVRLDLARGAVQRSYRGDILLQAENIRYDVEAGKQTIRILDGVSFTVYPTEFVGLLGPSGSGKTTLLMSLIGYIKPTYGRTLLNGDDLTTHYDRYRGAIGYVPQEDIIHSELTVYEALYYTAKLRLPPDTSDQEIDRRIHQVLDDLEISSTRNVRIGSPERKGISGGQRKRVNLALELLTEPALLCLDEPTSGLASEDALNVVRLLRRLADGGRTILLTIHQPSLQAYRLLDNSLYLADGEEVFYGPAFPDSILYFHPDVRPNTPEADTVLADPGTCMQPIMEAKRSGEPMETFAARYRQSRYFEEFVTDRKKNSADVAVTGKSSRKKPRFSFRQWMTLCRRYATIRLKDRIGMFILLIQAPIIALLLDLVFIEQSGDVLSRLTYSPYALFLLVVSAIWFGCSNAAREIVAEQAIYKRERMVNLSISAYVLSKFTVLGALCLVQCILLLVMTYFTLDFWGNPFYHLGILWLASLSGVGMGLLLSAVVRTSEAAMATVPLLLIPQIILGGAIMPVDKFSEPVWYTSQAVVSRWGFEAMLQAEHARDAYEISPDEMPKPVHPGLPAPPPPPNPIDRFYGDSETWLGLDFGMMGGFTFVLIGGVCVALRLRE